jgi:hypothetical protein
MKRIIAFLFVVFFVVLLTASFFVKPFIKSVAKGELEKIFPKSEVSIAGCTFIPDRKLTFQGIKIKRNKVYEFDIKEAGAFYDLISILRKKILKAYLKDAQIYIDLGQKSLLEFNKYLNLGSTNIFLVTGLQLANVDLELKSKEVNITTQLSLELNVIKQQLDSLDIKIDSLDSSGAHMQEAALKVAQGSSQGDFSIRQVKYDKAEAKEITSKAALKGKELTFSGLTARLFDGEIRADAHLTLDAPPEYAADLKFINIDIERFIKDFKLEEKFQMTGKLSGNITLKGKGVELSIIDGDFSAGEAGGIMVIKDDMTLKKMAQASSQPLDIFVESFKDYHYNTGVMKLYKKQKDLTLDIALEGEKGKRDLAVTIHDFTPH